MNRRGGFRLGAIRGIEIRLDPSVAIVLALVVYSLGAGLFPSWHDDWGPARHWTVAGAAGFLFIASLLAHELAHSLVAQLRGIAVPRITLFVFGGMSEMAREPDTPASELLIAIVGPIMSLLIGFLCTAAGLALAGESFAADVFSDTESAMASLGPAATLLLWLGPVNFMLGIFNLLPGFPLDGGRVFRATVWWITGDLVRATRWAANAGRGFAWALMAFGVLRLLQGELLPGIWLVLIGWFLQNAAISSQLAATLQRALTGFRVRNLMRTQFEVIDSGTPLESLLEEDLLRGGHDVWPVVSGERLIGMISLADVGKIPAAERRRLSIADAMRPITDHVRPDEDARGALDVLLRSNVDPLPVLEGERVVGLLHRADFARWLTAHELKRAAESRA